MRFIASRVFCMQDRLLLVDLVRLDRRVERDGGGGEQRRR